MDSNTLFHAQALQSIGRFFLLAQIIDKPILGQFTLLNLVRYNTHIKDSLQLQTRVDTVVRANSSDIMRICSNLQSCPTMEHEALKYLLHIRKSQGGGKAIQAEMSTWLSDDQAIQLAIDVRLNTGNNIIRPTAANYLTQHLLPSLHLQMKK